MRNSRLNCLAILLAGGEGKRLGLLTKERAKPAIAFGVKYRIIDFSLSNCVNSGIKTIGILAQYRHHTITSYIGDGSSWNLHRAAGGMITVLSPAKRNEERNIYRGTADAVFQNLNFIKLHNPCLVLVLAGDHIYQMNYRKLIDYHIEQQAEVTIASTEVPWEETNRFGILNTETNGRVIDFREKPKKAPNNLVSMGIYLFHPKILEKYLQQDQKNPQSSNDFGKDILPLMMADNRRIFAYPFRGYWMDVGTVRCFWKANMELLQENPRLELHNKDRPVYTAGVNQPRYYRSGRKIKRSLVDSGCRIAGEIDHSLLFNGVDVGKGSIIRDSIIMADVRIGTNTTIEKAIIDRNSIVGNNCRICPSSNKGDDLILIKENSIIPHNSIIESTGKKTAAGPLHEFLRRAVKGGDAYESAVYRF